MACRAFCMGSIAPTAICLDLLRMSNICCSCSLFLNHSGDAQGLRHQQGLHFSTASHLRVRGFKPLVQFSLPNTSERAIRKASFRLLARRSAALKKASPK